MRGQSSSFEAARPSRKGGARCATPVRPGRAVRPTESAGRHRTASLSSVVPRPPAPARPSVRSPGGQRQAAPTCGPGPGASAGLRKGTGHRNRCPVPRSGCSVPEALLVLRACRHDRGCQVGLQVHWHGTAIEVHVMKPGGSPKAQLTYGPDVPGLPRKIPPTSPETVPKQRVPGAQSPAEQRLLHWLRAWLPREALMLLSRRPEAEPGDTVPLNVAQATAGVGSPPPSGAGDCWADARPTPTTGAAHTNDAATTLRLISALRAILLSSAPIGMSGSPISGIPHPSPAAHWARPNPRSGAVRGARSPAGSRVRPPRRRAVSRRCRPSPFPAPPSWPAAPSRGRASPRP